MIEVTDSRGVVWRVNEDALRRFINGFSYTAAFLKHAKLARTEDHWLQKIGLADDHAHIDFDDKAIAKDKQMFAEAIEKTVLFQVKQDGTWAVEYVSQLVAQKTANDCARNGMFQSAQAVNAANIKWAERAITYAKGTRDLSVVAFGVIAGVASGGVTFYIAAGGATIGKGASVYQDTGKTGQALGAAGFQAITLGAGPVLKGVPALKNVKEVRAAVTLLIESGADFGENYLIKEEDLSKSLLSASVSLGMGAASEAWLDPVKKFVGTRINRALKLHGLGNSKLLKVTNAPTILSKQIGANRGVNDVTAKLVVASVVKGGEEAGKEALGGMPPGLNPASAKQARSAGMCDGGDPMASRRRVLSDFLFPADVALLSRLAAGSR